MRLTIAFQHVCMKDKIKIGITGASGLLGSHLAKELLQTGQYLIKGLHVSSFIPSFLKDEDIEWVQGDIRDYTVIEDFISDADIVIHAAALVSFKKKDSESLFEINVDATKNLVNQMIGTEKKLVHISSIATLGRKEGKKLIDENDFWNDSLNFTSYAHSKFLAEMEVERGFSEGLQTMIFQPSIILGATERNTSSSNIWTQIAKIPWLSPQGANGFVDVLDVVKYVKSGILDWKNGEKMIVSGHNLKYKFLYEKFNKSNNIKGRVRELNPKFLLLLLPITKLFFKICRIRSEISKSAVITTSKSYRFDNSKSITLYGDLYTPVEVTLHQILSTLKK